MLDSTRLSLALALALYLTDRRGQIREPAVLQLRHQIDQRAFAQFDGAIVAAQCVRALDDGDGQMLDARGDGHATRERRRAER